MGVTWGHWGPGLSFLLYTNLFHLVYFHCLGAFLLTSFLGECRWQIIMAHPPSPPKPHQLPSRIPCGYSIGYVTRYLLKADMRESKPPPILRIVLFNAAHIHLQEAPCPGEDDSSPGW